VGATVFFNSTNELATLSNTFKVNGTATDPTAVTLTVTSPSNVVTTYTWPSPATLTHGTAGVFSKDVACNEAGEWQYLWEGTTAASDAEAGTWTVQETSLGKLYCTPAALKSRLGITSTGDDYEIHEACFSASRAVEAMCERVFYRTATGTVRTFVPDGLYCTTFGAYNDLVTVTTLKTDAGGDGTFETTWSASDYQLHPVNPAAAPETRPYTKVKAVGVADLPSTVLRHRTGRPRPDHRGVRLARRAEGGQAGVADPRRGDAQAQGRAFWYSWLRRVRLHPGPGKPGRSQAARTRTSAIRCWSADGHVDPDPRRPSAPGSRRSPT
jgi:hypothetical protein